MCVLLGVAAAVQQGPIEPGLAGLALLGALLAHGAVNLFNEYEDFCSGLDATTHRTPFSGGSGVLPSHPEAAQATRAAAWACLLGTVLIGLFFVARHGLALLPLGVLGIAVVVTYTRWITHHWLACLIAPGLGFGPLMVMGTAFVLTGQYTLLAGLVSVTPFFLVSNLLLLNQFPDAAPDAQVGRRHLLVVAGPQTAARVYVVFLILAFGPVVFGLVTGRLPGWSALGLVPMAAVPVLAWRVLQHAKDVPSLVPFMGLNVVVCLATPALLAVGMMI